MSDLPATREEAQALGLPRYFTGKPCMDGHIAERHASGGACVECRREHGRQWRAANPEKVREGGRKWKAENRDKHHESARKWRAANPEKVREVMRNWQAANREKTREAVRKWDMANQEKRTALQAARRARQMKATPPWADIEAIKAIYAESARVSAETGIEHHVDHIVPLKGRTVCGLHVEANLRVIPAAENIAKGNKMTRDGVRVTHNTGEPSEQKSADA